MLQVVEHEHCVCSAWSVCACFSIWWLLKSILSCRQDTYWAQAASTTIESVLWWTKNKPPDQIAPIAWAHECLGFYCWQHSWSRGALGRDSPCSRMSARQRWRLNPDVCTVLDTHQVSWRNAQKFLDLPYIRFYIAHTSKHGETKSKKISNKIMLIHEPFV